MGGVCAQCSCFPVSVWLRGVLGSAGRRGSSVDPLAFTALPLLTTFCASDAILDQRRPRDVATSCPRKLWFCDADFQTKALAVFERRFLDVKAGFARTVSGILVRGGVTKFAA